MVDSQSPSERLQETETRRICAILRNSLDSGAANEAFWNLIRSPWTAVLVYDEQTVALVSEIVAKRGLVQREYLDPLETVYWLKIQALIPRRLIVWLAEDLLKRKRPFESSFVAMNLKCFNIDSKDPQSPTLKLSNDMTDDDATRLVRTLAQALRLSSDPSAAISSFKHLLQREPDNVENYLELLGTWMHPSLIAENAEKAIDLIASMPSELQRDPAVLEYKMHFFKQLGRYEDLYDICESSDERTRDSRFLPLSLSAQAKTHNSELPKELAKEISRIIDLYLGWNSSSTLSTLEVASLAGEYCTVSNSC